MHTPGPWSASEGQGFIRSTAVPSGESRICQVLRNVEANVRLIAASPKLLEVLKRAVAAFEYQIQVCHARDAAFKDTSISARPMDYQELVANMYAATAEPLAQARAAVEAASCPEHQTPESEE